MESRILEWWQEFAELEERCAWMQTPVIQRILRGRYVREIVKYADADSRIIELGCGLAGCALYWPNPVPEKYLELILLPRKLPSRKIVQKLLG